jgi:hypothetical protein
MIVRARLAAGTAAAFLSAAPNAAAHEGHGNPAWYQSVLHYFVEPEHVPVTLLVIVAALFASSWGTRKLKLRLAHARRR